ncbi:hypothetical protein BH10CYA1_BH10CYA1_58400 [soil metagenome]
MPSGVDLDVVHMIFQIAFGWTDSHLHEFESNGIRYGQIEFGEDDPEMLDERRYSLMDLLKNEGDAARYRYDFGDCWEFYLQLERVTAYDYDYKTMLFGKCIGGKRACPPEDVGGTDGYRRFLNVIEDPEHEERKELLEWLEIDFDPDSFDVDSVNMQIQSIAQQCNERYDQKKKAATVKRRKNRTQA